MSNFDFTRAYFNVATDEECIECFEAWKKSWETKCKSGETDVSRGEKYKDMIRHIEKWRKKSGGL